MSDFIYDEHDLCKGLAATTSGLINPRSINYLPDDDFEAINDIRRPTAPLTMSQLDLTPDFTRGVGFGDTSIFNEADTVYGQRSGSHVPRILLEGDFSDLGALRAIVKLEPWKNGFKPLDYSVVVRKMLFEWKLSDCLDNTWLSSGALRCPHEHARVFRRLRTELACLYSEDCDWENQSDSQRFYECLGDLDSDIVKAYDPFKSKEGEVYVSKEIEPYQDCLQSVVEVLENC